MDIQKAIERVEFCRANIVTAQSAISELKTGGKEVDISGRFGEYGGPVRNICLDRRDLITAIQASCERHEAEIAKLQPVIDMANAALKGIHS